MSKKIYRSVDRSIDLDVDSYIYGTLIEFQSRIEELIVMYGEHATINTEPKSYDYDSQGVDIVIRWVSPETEQERDKRLADARKLRLDNKARKSEAEKIERAQLKRLLEKYKS